MGVKSRFEPIPQKLEISEKKYLIEKGKGSAKKHRETWDALKDAAL